MSNELIARDAISTVITRLFLATDRRDWIAVRSCLEDRVLFDMTSLAGGDPATLTSEQITQAWEAGLRPIEQVHHQIGNLVIEGTSGESTATCYGIAYHYRNTKSGRNTRTFVGSYELELREHARGTWRIATFRFKLKFIDGNRHLENEAGA